MANTFVFETRAAKHRGGIGSKTRTHEGFRRAAQQYCDAERGADRDGCSLALRFEDVGTVVREEASATTRTTTRTSNKDNSCSYRALLEAALVAALEHRLGRPVSHTTSRRPGASRGLHNSRLRDVCEVDPAQEVEPVRVADTPQGGEAGQTAHGWGSEGMEVVVGFLVCGQGCNPTRRRE